MQEVVDSLLRDKTRKPGKSPLPAEVVQRVIDLTLAEPPDETTHWSVRAMANAAGIGAVTGSAVGLAFGVAFVTALEEQGVSELSVPGPRLALYAVAAAVAGVLAAVGPARRAADVDVLRAVVTD